MITIVREQKLTNSWFTMLNTSDLISKDLVVSALKTDMWIVAELPLRNALSLKNIVVIF